MTVRTVGTLVKRFRFGCDSTSSTHASYAAARRPNRTAPKRQAHTQRAWSARAYASKVASADRRHENSRARLFPSSTSRPRMR